MKKTLTNEETAALCLELSMLLRAGVLAGDALALLAQENQGTQKTLLEAMARDVDEGISLSGAMKNTGVFSQYVQGLVEVGERSGHTEEALSALSRYYEDRVRMDRRIRSALLYPAVMLGLMLVVIGVLLVRVLPIFDDVYASMGGQLTGIARGLLVFGRWLDRAMPVLWVLLVLLAVFFAAFALFGAFRDKVKGAVKKKFGDRGISRQITTAQVAQAVAMSMASGLPMEEALTLAAGLVEDVPAAEKRCLSCREQLEQGSTPGAAMQESGLLPAGSCRVLELARKSGAGETAMEKIASDLSEECDAAIESLVSRVEPALVLVCSLLVGLILLSVMLPLMDIMAAIG